MDAWWKHTWSLSYVLLMEVLWHPAWPPPQADTLKIKVHMCLCAHTSGDKGVRYHSSSSQSSASVCGHKRRQHTKIAQTGGSHNSGLSFLLLKVHPLNDPFYINCSPCVMLNLGRNLFLMCLHGKRRMQKNVMNWSHRGSRLTLTQLVHYNPGLIYQVICSAILELISYRSDSDKPRG